MSDFQTAVEFVLKHEGGYVDHPNDPGGATNYGISSRAHGLTPEEVKNLTREDAKTIYKLQYWEPLACERMTGALALIVFDSGVQHGVSRAKAWYSQVGPHPHAYLAKRLRFYTSLKGMWPSFGRGWMNRMADLIETSGRSDALSGLTLVQVYDGDSRWDFQPEEHTVGRTLEGDRKLMVRVSPSSFWERLRFLFGASA